MTDVELRANEMIQKFIDCLESQKGTDMYTTEADLDLQAYKTAMDALLFKTDNWIPCSERLPEYYEIVLITAKMPDDKEWLTYMAAKQDGDSWNLCGVMNSGDYDVTAWQPLPKPYELVCGGGIDE